MAMAAAAALINEVTRMPKSSKRILLLAGDFV